MFDFYGGLGGPGMARRVNFRITGDAEDYLNDIELALAETARAVAGIGGADVRLPAARACEIRPLPLQRRHGPSRGLFHGGLRGITGEMLDRREELVFAWCREHARATAFVLAGGYVSRSLDEKALVDLHRLTLRAAAGAAAPG